MAHMTSQVNVIAVEYPGYGLLSEMSPSEDALYRTAHTVRLCNCCQTCQAANPKTPTQCLPKTIESISCTIFGGVGAYKIAVHEKWNAKSCCNYYFCGGVHMPDCERKFYHITLLTLQYLFNTQESLKRKTPMPAKPICSKKCATQKPKRATQVEDYDLLWSLCRH
eukprot:4514286-Amphidinium_carterae.1